MKAQDFRDYHLLLVERAAQIFAMTDDVEERARKIGGITPCSIGDISEHECLKCGNEESVVPDDDE